MPLEPRSQTGWQQQERVRQELRGTCPTKVIRDRSAAVACFRHDDHTRVKVEGKRAHKQSRVCCALVSSFSTSPVVGSLGGGAATAESRKARVTAERKRAHKEQGVLGVGVNFSTSPSQSRKSDALAQRVTGRG